MSSPTVTIVENTSIRRYKYCVVSAPDVGLAGAIALGYVIEEQQMEEVGYLESEAFLPVMVVHRGDPKPPVRIYHKGDIAAFISEIPIDPFLIPSTSSSIVDWAKTKNVEILIALSGIGVQNRLEIEVPEVYGVGSSSSVKGIMKTANIEILEEGFITGLHATLMKECLKSNVPCLIILSQSHLQFPDPGAAASIIASLNKLTGLNVNTKKLLNQEDEVRLKMRELMQRTQQQMRQTQKGREQEIPPMYV